MATDNTGAGSRAFRIIGRSIAVLAALAAVAFLLVASTVAWIFGVALPHHQHEIDDQSAVSARGLADHYQGDLASAATDGKLTDSEITKVVGSFWTIERSSHKWAVTTRYAAGSNIVCFRFDVALPLGPDTGVTYSELAECPLIQPRPDAS
jgi:hypothetical protein